MLETSILSHTQKEFSSLSSIVSTLWFLGPWSPGCCYEQQCYCIHPMMWLLVYAHLCSVPRSRINGSYILHVFELSRCFD